jgi:hypothetical protein
LGAFVSYSAADAEFTNGKRPGVRLPTEADVLL